MLGRDGIAGIICLGLSIAMLVMTRDLPHSPLVPIGPDFYPRIVLSVGALLSAILVAADIVTNLRGRAAATAAAPSPVPAAKKNYALVLLTFVVFTVYVALLPWLGYRIATFLFVAVEQAVLERPASRRRWVVVFITAAATSFVTYVVFEHYLQVLLPRGSWTGV
jgi:putative tricarboxylic transport membrane protein